MSAHLWRYFLQQDVDAFRQFVADATHTSAASSRPGAASNVPHQIGSPTPTSSLPAPSPKTRKSWGGPQHGTRSLEGKNQVYSASLTRADVNSKDSFGRTLLHHAASSCQPNAVDFVSVLLSIPYLDLYVQDAESGWTALHRALYFGNVAIAQVLMLRDIKDATDYTTSGLRSHAGGLIKIKDHEGNSPFEVFGLTIAPRTLAEDVRTLAADTVDDESGNSVDLDQIGNEENGQRRPNKARVNLLGDDVFAFGSNKNLSLGLGDEDDRQYPERVNLRRPEHLLRRFHQEHTFDKILPTQDLSASRTNVSANHALPALIRNQALEIQDVIMSKLHTVVVTNDPEANFFVCGFGPGGRLGTGDEATRFSYVCIEGGGLAGKRVVAVALGQDHTIAVSASGEVFTWGSNKFGQLGYNLPQSSATGEAPVQLVPRQLYGPMKKEAIVGAAASSIHSAIFTSSALYTFGKNEGQLGLMDADARSLEVQVIPRRVGVSVLQSAIEMVSAIDRATSILLENHDLIVLTHYGFTKVVFQLEGFTNYFLQGSYATRYDPAGSYVRKVTSGGNTICAMSSFGEVFTIDVTKKVESTVGVSTTNPSKARNALPYPTRVWSIRKAHMAATDVAVGQSGSVILSTEAGSVWRKEKRAIIKDFGSNMPGRARSKDYKFVRIPNLTRAVAVRSNAFGAFTAIRRDCGVTREQIVVDPPSIWNDLLPLLPFKEYGKVEETSDTEEPLPRFWISATSDTSPAHTRRAVLLAQDAEADFMSLLSKFNPLADSQYDLWVTSNVTDVRIPVHSFLVKSRSCVLRRGLAEFQNTYYFSLTDVFSIEYGQDGQIQIRFQGADFLTITNFVFYIYTENIINVWHHTAQAPRSAARYRQVRTELMKIATNLEMKALEKAARVMTEPAKCLQLDLESAILDKDFFSDADLLIELADGAQMPAHSAMLCCRCPFFDGLFHGRAGGAWISSRRTNADETAETVKVDFKHIEAKTFRMVLQHIYADTGEELFDDVVTNDLDEFLDLVIEVMAVANELMLDRLAQICQKLLGKFVTTRNVCQLLNTVAPCSVKEFKYAGLEYICLNLETMLEHRFLEELDEELLAELDEVVRQNQLAFLPFAKSGRAEADLLEQHAGLAGALAQARERKIDSMRLRSRLHEDEERAASLKKFRVGSWGKSSSATMDKTGLKSPKQRFSPGASPALVAQDAGTDLLFEMDEEKVHHRGSPRLRLDPNSPDLQAQDLENALEVETSNPEGDGWLEARGKQIPDSVSTDASSLGGSFHRPQYSSSTVASRTPQSSTLTSGSTSQNTPWNAIRSASGKTGLKDIMAEASVSRLSNLTLAMNAKSSEHAKGMQKMSQKERKKMQKQPDLKKDKASQSPAVSISNSPGLATSAPTSPWRPIRPNPRPDLNVSVSPGLDHLTVSTKLAVRPPTRTTMTMRQTVAGAPPMGKPESTWSKQTRSVSTPMMTPVSKPSSPQIQSIRHTPAPAAVALSYTEQSSMTDILLQQQTEKTAVKEAVAKRSLQEIQQQQEFEEWFDSESRRVQEEEAQATAVAAATPGNGRGNSGRGRGRGRGGHTRGSGRGELKAVDGRPLVSATSARRGSAQKQASESAKAGGPLSRGRAGVAPRAGPS